MLIYVWERKILIPEIDGLRLRYSLLAFVPVSCGFQCRRRGLPYFFALGVRIKWRTIGPMFYV